MYSMLANSTHLQCIGGGNTNDVHNNAGCASCTGSTSASTTLTITGNRSSRGGNSCICITFSYCGQFSLHWIECWHELCWVWNCSVNRTDLKLFRRQILWLEPFKINNNNKKLLDLWTECDNQPTDGTDETRINQEINTNRDDTKEKIEVRERLRL